MVGKVNTRKGEIKSSAGRNLCKRGGTKNNRLPRQGGGGSEVLENFAEKSWNSFVPPIKGVLADNRGI